MCIVTDKSWYFSGAIQLFTFHFHEGLYIARRGLWSVPSFRYPCWRGPRQCQHVISSGPARREKLQLCITCLYIWCLSGKPKSSNTTFTHNPLTRNQSWDYTACGIGSPQNKREQFDKQIAVLATTFIWEIEPSYPRLST